MERAGRCALAGAIVHARILHSSIPPRIIRLYEIAAFEGRGSTRDSPRLENDPAEDDEKDGADDITAGEGEPMPD